MLGHGSCWESPSSSTLHRLQDTAAPGRAVTLLLGEHGDKGPAWAQPWRETLSAQPCLLLLLQDLVLAKETGTLHMHQWVPLIQGKVGCPCQVRTSENQLEDSPKLELWEVQSAASPGTSPQGTHWA